MSDPTRRHPNVLNVSEVEPRERLVGTRMGGSYRNLTGPAGGSAIGCSWFEIAPGRSAMPRHFHCGNEEAIFVLEGRGTARIGDASVAIGPGDWVSFPIGPEHAHQVTNTGDQPLRYLALSTKINVDVVGYPDSKKIMAWAGAPGAPFDAPPWIRHLTEEEKTVDYFHREKID